MRSLRVDVLVTPSGALTQSDVTRRVGRETRAQVMSQQLRHHVSIKFIYARHMNRTSTVWRAREVWGELYCVRTTESLVLTHIGLPSIPAEVNLNAGHRSPWGRDPSVCRKRTWVRHMACQHQLTVKELLVLADVSVISPRKSCIFIM